VEGEEAKKEEEKEKKRERCKGEGCHKLLGFFWKFYHFLLEPDPEIWSFQNYRKFQYFENSPKRRQIFGNPYYHHHDDEQRHDQQ